MAKHGLALVTAAVCLVVASCSETVGPPPATPSTSTSTATKTTVTAAPPPAVTGPLEKDWKSYGGTAYFGCPDKFSLRKSALEDIRPKVFNTKTGQYVMPGMPSVPADENVTGGICALTGAGDDMKVVYVVTTAKPGQAQDPAATKATGYLFDFKTSQPVVTKELQPPTPDLKLTAADGWGLAATTSGVAWVNAFTDGHGAASPPRTVVLSGTDLSMMWNDPQPGRVWEDILAFQRNTDPAKTTGAELRRPNGEAIYQDNDVSSVDAELSDGPDKLVKITHADSYNPPVMSTMFYDLNAKSLIKIGDSDRIPGGGLSATLSDGKLFVDGHKSETSPFGFGVWNLRTQHWDLLKTRDEAKSISKLAFFEDHVYITNVGNTFAVLALPAPDPISTTWAVRPFARISGWTLECRGENVAALNGECREIVMVQDQDGHFPGPWF